MKPDSYTLKELFLDVGSGHHLYCQEWGNKRANSPIIYLHGGPGRGLDNSVKDKFDPKIHKVIFFDQRASGNSKFEDPLKDNNTSKLLSDINKIINKFKVKQPVLYGGSWGACLALLFAIPKSKKIKGLILTGVTSCSESEIDWFLDGSFKSFYPDVWQDFLEVTPNKYHDKAINYHVENILGSDKTKAKRSAYYFDRLILSILKLEDKKITLDIEDYDNNGALIEAFYLKNKYFLTKNYILKNASKIKCPVYMVQGRYDMLCPPFIAYSLNKILPSSQLYMTINGHSNGHEASQVTSILLNQLLNN